MRAARDAAAAWRSGARRGRIAPHRAAPKPRAARSSPPSRRARRSARFPMRCAACSASTVKSQPDAPLLSVEHLTTVFRLADGRDAPAVDDVSFSIAARRDARPGRRIGQRQVRHRALDHPARHAARPHRGRTRRVRRPRSARRSTKRGDAGGPRPPHRLRVPGADGRAQSRLHDRLSDRGDAGGARPGARRGGQAPRRRTARGGARARSRSGACATIPIN